MTLVTRFWLSGALFPLLVLAAALFGADRMFHGALEGSLDRALLAQAAVESVSLFDGPRGEPHLHMSTSPLVESVRPFAPVGLLYGPDGALVMRYPPGARDAAGARVLPEAAPGAPPRLATYDAGSVRERILTVVVASPSGRPYTLRLVAGLAQLEVAAETFHRLALLALTAVAVVLLTVQTWTGRSLQRRLRSLSSHAEALRAGELSRPLARERQRDELAALRDVLADATEALRVASESRERFIADAAHELRTPLTLMRTSLDLALRRERSSDELKDALVDAREQVERLSHLATRLLDLAVAAHDEEEREAVDLGELLADAVDAARADALERGLTLHVEVPPAAVVEARPQALRRAVDNLLSNALKFAKRDIVLSATLRGDHMLVSVQDDGPGIPQAEWEPVFEPFHRVRGSVGGAGLGLALVREVARRHGGRAYVRPSQRGTDVVLELPRGALA